MTGFRRKIDPRAWFLAVWWLCPVAHSRAQMVVEVGQNFAGISYGDSNTNSAALPPDCNGAVGTNYFVEFINGIFAVYAKSDGHRVRLMTDLDFWANAGVGISGDWDVSDPRIIYDPTAQRWFASEVDLDVLGQVLDGVLGSNHFLLAVSADADPTGQWNGVAFDSDPDNGNFADFPTLGVDGQGVYLSGDMYPASGDPTDPTLSGLGPSLVSFPKSDLLAPTPIFTNRTWFGIMNRGERGQVLQPATCADGSSSGSMLAAGNIGTDSSPHSSLVAFAVQNASAPAGTTLSPSTFITVDPYVVPNNATVGAPAFTPMQPDGTAALMANDARLSAKVYAVGGVLYAVQSTELNGRIAIRWYRVRAADGTLLESGTVTAAGLDLFYPSIAANAAGTLVISYNGCSIDTFVSCYAIVGKTVNGVTAFGDPLLLQSGVTSYHGDDEAGSGLDPGSGTSRWGDYSATSVDPADPNRFWTIQAYPSDTDVWSTQITELLTADPTLSLAFSGTNAVISWPGTAVRFNLESNTNLAAAGDWTLVTQNLSTNDGQISVQIPLAAGTMFFRLHKP